MPHPDAPRPGLPRGGDQQIPRPESWSTGAPAAWVERDLNVLADGAEVRSRLASKIRDAVSSEVGGRYDSAVLVPLIDTVDGPALILTRRSRTLTHHKGEIAFPGGHIDDGESPEDAALREANEEIALAAEHVEVIGRLQPMSTRLRRNQIAPILASVAEDAGFFAASSEVDRVFTVPLVELATSFRRETWHLPGNDIEIHFYDLVDETVWGATARAVTNLVELLTL